MREVVVVHPPHAVGSPRGCGRRATLRRIDDRRLRWPGAV